MSRYGILLCLTLLTRPCALSPSLALLKTNSELAYFAPRLWLGPGISSSAAHCCTWRAWPPARPSQGRPPQF
ncbi:hypothetical protein BD626DRAFT_473221 [Schizophyllum amplum]|uniref:Uncharacterized protein n=1 Tax=Schizophyllum amplum TaxID=97359 RepID=A0A550CWN0_9AGAR|nr:hypothetical protein BD626DRAFT_473221 [Auriculariopsis ampla]